MWKLRNLTVEHHPQINIDLWSLIGGDAVLKPFKADAQCGGCAVRSDFPRPIKSKTRAVNQRQESRD